MRNFKKGVSLMLASIMILGSFTPILATVEETQTTSTSETLTTDVYFNQDSSFTVTIPKLVTLDSSKTSAYEVTVTGDIASDEEIKVIPENTFQMKDQSAVNQKADVEASVIQDKASWLFNEFEQKGNGTITAPDLTAGTWKGFLNFNISLENDSVKVISIVDSTGTDLNGTAKNITGYNKEKLLSELAESELVDDIANVKSIIDINTDDFTDTATATFDVSKIAKAGEQIAIYHYDEENTAWEYINTATVDENGKIIVNMDSFSPVAFEIKKLVPGLYDENNNLICTYEESGLNAVASYGSAGYDDSTVNGYYILRKVYTTTTKVVLPEDVTSIGNYNFKSCSKLTDIVLTENVTRIGEYSFQAAGLTSINIPNGVQTIGYKAFDQCNNLTSINISETVNDIDLCVFNDCNLLKITVDENNPIYDSRNNCNAIIETATNELIYGSAKTIIPDSVETIGTNSFAGRKSLTNIDIPNSVTKISYSAFQDCTALTNITIPNSITHIYSGVFEDCTALTTATLSDNLTYLGAYAFRNCTSLTSVEYKGITYTSINELTSALSNNGVDVNAEMFKNTGLEN